IGRDSLNEYKPFEKLCYGLGNFDETLKLIEKIFDNKGYVRDDASPTLQELRPQVSILEKKITHKLQKILKSDDNIFQEKVVTKRNNRFVIPIRRESKNRIRGIIHDESTSGRTLFIEPESVVSNGNELVSTIKDIDNEVRKILSTVTQELRLITKDIEACFRALTVYDMAYAVSAWAMDFSCTFAKKADNYNLIKARHPVLQEKFRRDDQEDLLAPLDLGLKNAKVLAITGSNTGGKTVALKTIGLFSLIYQTGLPIPADKGSALPFFEQIFADIGDEQSLEQSLSTFSGHLKNIVEILNSTHEKKSLVLLDELGSGTDPMEGGSLGCAIISSLAERNCMTFLTTHLGMIKVFVHESKSMVNASVRFNRETLEPEYTLEVGLPGASHALAIAQRLNIPKEVISKANSFISDDELKLENVLERLDSKQRSLARDADLAKSAREEAVTKRDILREELKDLKEKRRQMLNDAQKEASAIVENSRKEMEKLLKSLKNNEALPKNTGELRKKVEEKRDNLRKASQKTEAKPTKPVNKDELKVGMRVWIPKVKDYGVIQTISDDKKKVEVDVHGLPIQMKASALGQADQITPETKKAQAVARLNYKKSNVKMELNLIGQRAEPAIKKLEGYLDRALAADLHQVRIIHGRGTGSLRQAVHECLRNTSYVAKFSCPQPGENSPGDTVTDVLF
ncbi:MAG: endonuclease MutS2, partial [Lentisphaeraceae bacterium]|nr:endonuclease MutS2 [Lentisphaeraceae bacterium]